MATVLLVEDRARLRDATAALLTAAGHEVECARNGREALERYPRLLPDLVLVDLFMPVMNGFDTIYLLHLEYPDALVVAMGDAGDAFGEGALDEALDLGAECAVAKPLRRRVLLEMIDELLAS